MRFTVPAAQIGRIHTKFIVLLILFSLFVLPGCHRHHRSTSVTKPQATIVKRQLDADGAYYVRKGDTLYAIAFSYGLDPMEVAKLNRISSPYTIYPDQKLQLKSPVSSSASRETSSGVKITGAKTPGQVTTKTIASPAASTRAAPEPAKSTPVPASSVKTVKPTSVKPSVTPPVSSSAGSKGWKWPTNGRVVRGFVAGDPARNGLDIAGKEGQAITASSAGQVVYSGNGLIGYGELIIVKHNEKMLSAYAHNRVRLVKEGDEVWAGQKIAEMGRNSSNEQLLHFEIRALGKPTNPLNYLPKK
jgi:lipoprotein NlpD